MQLLRVSVPRLIAGWALKIVQIVELIPETLLSMLKTKCVWRWRWFWIQNRTVSELNENCCPQQWEEPIYQKEAHNTQKIYMIFLSFSDVGPTNHKCELNLSCNCGCTLASKQVLSGVGTNPLLFAKSCYSYPTPMQYAYSTCFSWWCPLFCFI